jgi:hypothetical protein
MSSTDTEQAIDLAEQAAEAVRALNYLTRRPGTPADPADTYLLLAALTTLAQRLPQLLTQINRQLDTDLDPTQLRVDDWAPIHDPAALIDHVCSDLHCASQHADRLGTALDSAQQAIAHIAVADTHQPNERPEITEQGVSFRPQPEGQFSAAVDIRCLLPDWLINVHRSTWTLGVSPFGFDYGRLLFLRGLINAWHLPTLCGPH